MKEFKCKICLNTYNNKSYAVREMMFGKRHEFDYTKCSNCGCLQIEQIPQNISEYYPKEFYYSYSISSLSPIQKIIKKYLLRKLFNYYIGKFSTIGYLASKFYYLKKRYEWVRILRGIDKSSNILDIGSGSGKYLDELFNCGYTKIKGIDPYNDKDIITDNGISITKQQLFDISGNYDLIMLNHVFEHMDNPNEIFAKINTLLTISGKILIRVPLVDSYAWNEYGVNWYQIDAPRHFYLYTKKSMQLLANKNGFEIEKVMYDSNDYQFIFSEQYKQDKTIKSPILFEKSQINIWRKKADQLNSSEDGDQACFVLIRNNSNE